MKEIFLELLSATYLGQNISEIGEQQIGGFLKETLLSLGANYATTIAAQEN